MKYIFAVLVSLSLGGCMAIEPIAFKGPSGRDAYSMKCSGMGRNMQACYQKAGEVCPKGYNIIENSSSSVAYMDQGTMMMVPRREMAIECK